MSSVVSKNITIKEYLDNPGHVPYSKTAVMVMKLYSEMPETADMSVDMFFEHVYNLRVGCRYSLTLSSHDELHDALSQYIRKFGVNSCIFGGVGSVKQLYIMSEELAGWLTLSGMDIRKVPNF